MGKQGLNSKPVAEFDWAALNSRVQEARVAGGVPVGVGFTVREYAGQHGLSSNGGAVRAKVRAWVEAGLIQPIGVRIEVDRLGRPKRPVVVYDLVEK